MAGTTGSGLLTKINNLTNELNGTAGSTLLTKINELTNRLNGTSGTIIYGGTLASISTDSESGKLTLQANKTHVANGKTSGNDARWEIDVLEGVFRLISYGTTAAPSTKVPISISADANIGELGAKLTNLQTQINNKLAYCGTKKGSGTLISQTKNLGVENVLPYSFLPGQRTAPTHSFCIEYLYADIYDNKQICLILAGHDDTGTGHNVSFGWQNCKILSTW